MNKIILIFFLIAMSFSASGGDIDPSGYSLYSGGKFYVLTDGVFSTDETIKVRFEASGNGDVLKKYGGVDVRLYSIPKPLDFLRAQKNLHRPEVKGRYDGEGLTNVLSYLWDSWYKKARLAWQRVFSTKAREAVVAKVPELKQVPAHTYRTNFLPESQFKPIPGMTMVDSFRYPIWEAKVNQPPKETVMEGSSSNFITTAAGNVMLPLGKRKPGLYLVEAMIGSFRATTLAFVSDSLVVTKVSSNQALVWTVNRSTGISQPKSKVVLTDGIGVLDQGTGDSDGVYVSKREIPERTFAMVEDEAGGVAVSENFFYDSEVYQPKIYMFTDRPLYQPGDLVSVRAFGRDLKRDGSKDVWSALSGSGATVTVLDSSGIPLLSRIMPWSGIEGGEVQFKLPNSAQSGGYSLKLRFDGEDYGAAFRVARFTKPHFDAQIIFGKPSYKVGEAVSGRVILSYPSGQPVVNADIDLQLRSERMTVYEGSYGYNGAAPIELKQKSYRSNKRGEVTFVFPAAEKPSRYIATARAFDQAAYRVTTKKEIMIEGYQETYILTSEFNATEPGTAVKISFDRQGSDAADLTQKLKTWQAIRLEDRSVVFGPVPSIDRGEFTVNFAKPGHYVVRVVDAGGVTRGVRSHVVLGPDLKSATGQVEILADREAYSIGDTANLLLTFPGQADDALLTLERNEVSSYGRLGKGANWFKAKRLSSAQWRVEVPIRDVFAPNIIFSVASSQDGQFSFQNKGLVVKKPMIDIVFKPNKSVFAPNEKVIVDIETKFNGKPIPALVAVGVVDEMIYVLQPEIAPSVGEFFHHIRKNQVRTTSSLSFYSFNPATSEVDNTKHSNANRDVKLQERARRDARDTAYWNGSIKTDSEGKARFEFTMADALTRWRMTARAISMDSGKGGYGAVGEAKGYILSNQDFYLKWTGPTLFRTGDNPKPAIIAFNSTNRSSEAEISMNSSGYSFSQKISMKPGANTVILDKVPEVPQEIESRLTVAGNSVDLLATKINFIPSAWTETQSQIVKLDKNTKFALPQGASKVRLKVIPDSSFQFQRIADDLMEYPWGCVEQTSSRLIPMVMAANALQMDNTKDPMFTGLRDQIAADRRRLIEMAGPQAAFSWWGDQTDSSLMMTAHAYHADFRASKFLGIEIPKEDWKHLLKIYALVKAPSLLERAYALWVLSYIGQPVSEQVNALLKDIAIDSAAPRSKQKSITESVVIDSSAETNDLPLLILGLLANDTKVPLSPQVKARLELLARTPWESPVLRAAALAYGARAKTSLVDLSKAAEDILESVKFETPTIDRSMTLALVEGAFPQPFASKRIAKVAELGGDWQREGQSSSSFAWRGKGLPSTIPVVAGAVGEVLYESAEEPKSTLDISIVRKIYRVVFNDEAKNSEKNGLEMELDVAEMKAGEAFDSRALYLDEISVDPKGRRGNFLLLEAPLPPGGEVDGKTWGLSFLKLKPYFVEPRSSPSGLGYSIPVESVSVPIKFHQLIRFSSRGSFQLPPIKLFKMYRTRERAFETGVTSRAIVVQ